VPDYGLSEKPVTRKLQFSTDMASQRASSSGGRRDYQVLEQDILEAAGQLVEGGFKVAVLNMASATCPGGGFESGAGAQEENLHRRSDAVRFTKEQRKNYPIPEDGCLLSPDVTVFRASEKNNYAFLEEPFKVTMLSCAAITHPRLTKAREYAYREDHELMERKVAVLLQAAARCECDAIVLSAFGCGAFGNPPEVVAQLFHAGLQRSPLRSVRFCILNDHNAGSYHNPRGNFKPFQEVFR